MSGLLLVCRANVCRSRLAEALMRARLGDGFPLHSVGVGASVGSPVCPLVAQRLQVLDIPRPSGEARAATSTDLHRADLILTAGLEERSEVIRHDLETRDRTFTLLEAVWLTRAEGLGTVSSLAHLAEQLSTLRPTTPPPHQSQTRFRRRPVDPFDIPDGHRGSIRQHRRTLLQVEEAAEELVKTLAAIKEP